MPKSQPQTIKLSVFRADILGTQRRFLDQNNYAGRYKIAGQESLIVARAADLRRVLITAGGQYHRGRQHRSLAHTIGEGLIASDEDK
ncbi:MAG: hypothetical protein AAF125_24275, partial [Chloroflexota bacterium]